MLDLKTILSWVRPHGSEGERQFSTLLQREIENLGYTPTVDGFGNIFVVHPTSETLLTAHIDTVHAKGLPNRQDVSVSDDGLMYLTKPEACYCLGADDGTGIYILLRLLEAQVPVSFAFYRGEELGGLGSDDSVQGNPDFYLKFKRAIAFDRKGVDSVITHQFGDRCCSDEFAECLSAGLNRYADWFQFMPDDTGTFTDTANLMHIIPECTNLSVGYYDHHTSGELQDSAFAEALVEALVSIDWERLPTVRDPAAKSDWSGSGVYEDFDELQFEADAVYQYGRQYAEDLVYNNPELAIDLLLDLVK